MKEYTIQGHFKFDNSIVLDAENEQEAIKRAKKHLWELIKDHLSDKDNIRLEITSRELSDEEIVEDLKNGYILKETAEVKRAVKRESKRLEKVAKDAEKESKKRGRKPKEK